MGFTNINRNRRRVVSKKFDFFLADPQPLAQKGHWYPMNGSCLAQPACSLAGGGKLLPTDLGLLVRLRNADDFAAWQEFSSLYRKLIHRAAIRARLSAAEADEVLQETMICVAHRMETFRYEPERCSFKGWLMHLTRRRIIDCLRKRRSRAPLFDSMPLDSTREGLAGEIADPQAEQAFEAMWTEEWQHHLLESAERRVRCSVKPLHYEIYDRHCVQGLPVKEVSQLFKVLPLTVRVVSHRVAQKIKREVRRLQTQLQ